MAVPDVADAARDADILIFVVPHQFIHRLCKTLLGNIKPTAVGLSLIKGFDKKEGGGIELISHIIANELHIPCSVLMGANLASEVADEMFCETTIGNYIQWRQIWQNISKHTVDRGKLSQISQGKLSAPKYCEFSDENCE